MESLKRWADDVKTDDDDIVDDIVVKQAKEFDCEDGEDSLKVTTFPQSLQTVKVNEKTKIWKT